MIFFTHFRYYQQNSCMFNHLGIYPDVFIYLDKDHDPPNVQHKVTPMYSNMYIYNRLEQEAEHSLSFVQISVCVGSTQQNANKYDLKTWLSTKTFCFTWKFTFLVNMTFFKIFWKTLWAAWSFLNQDEMTTLTPTYRSTLETSTKMETMDR